MIRQENINFVASKYAPNPTEVAYWIDLSADSSGNVIKSNTNGMWIPINNSDNTDQTEQINQIKSNLNAEISRATQAEQNLATTLATKADSEAIYTKQETTDIVNAAKVTVNNTLTSDSIVEALSAAQGKQLMDLINALTDRVTALETPEVPTV